MHELLRRRKWAHWLAGHGWPKEAPFRPEELAEKLRAKGMDEPAVALGLILSACTLVDRCSCGDSWRVEALSMTEVFRPKKETTP